MDKYSPLMTSCTAMDVSYRRFPWVEKRPIRLVNYRICAILALITGAIINVQSAAAAGVATLYRFSGEDGMFPVGALVRLSNQLVGVTYGGGVSNRGSAFGIRLQGVGSAISSRLVDQYSFSGPSVGARSTSGLLFADNAVFGTTQDGGAQNRGTVFEITRTQDGSPVVTTIHVFQGPDGSAPSGSLIADKLGNIYGVTSGFSVTGGSNSSNCGTVFQLVPPSNANVGWTFNLLHAFTISSSGANECLPYAGLIMRNGALFGTTLSGSGTVFELSPNAGTTGWTEKVLHQFVNGSGGSGPSANLQFHGDSLIGTTQYGGANSLGTIFELSPPSRSGSTWTETVLHSFASDAWFPTRALVTDASGLIYGTLGAGNGAIFKLTPPSASVKSWKTDIIYRFTGNEDGSDPSGLTFDRSSGRLYGVTRMGGQAGDASVTGFLSGYGTVFEVVQ